MTIQSREAPSWNFCETHFSLMKCEWTNLFTHHILSPTHTLTLRPILRQSIWSLHPLLSLTFLSITQKSCMHYVKSMQVLFPINGKIEQLPLNKKKCWRNILLSISTTFSDPWRQIFVRRELREHESQLCMNRARGDVGWMSRKLRQNQQFLSKVRFWMQQLRCRTLRHKVGKFWNMTMPSDFKLVLGLSGFDEFKWPALTCR